MRRPGWLHLTIVALANLAAGLALAACGSEPSSLSSSGPDPARQQTAVVRWEEDLGPVDVRVGECVTFIGPDRKPNDFGFDPYFSASMFKACADVWRFKATEPGSGKVTMYGPLDEAYTFQVNASQ